MAGLLQDTSGNPLPGRTLNFVLGVQTATATTDANGVGKAQIVPTTSPGNVALSLTYAGDSSTAASSGSATVSLVKEETVLAVSSGAYLGAGAAQSVSARLTESSGAPIAGKSISFTVSGATATATTNASGVAIALITPVTAQGGTAQLSASFAGDSNYLASSTQTPVTLYQTSQFVIWGGNSTALALGQDVNFWGDSWANQMTGGELVKLCGALAQMGVKVARGLGRSQPGKSLIGLHLD